MKAKHFFKNYAQELERPKQMKKEMTGLVKSPQIEMRDDGIFVKDERASEHFLSRKASATKVFETKYFLEPDHAVV